MYRLQIHLLFSLILKASIYAADDLRLNKSTWHIHVQQPSVNTRKTASQEQEIIHSEYLVTDYVTGIENCTT